MGTKHIPISERWNSGFRRHVAQLAIGAFMIFALIGLFLVIVQPQWKHLYEIESCVGLLGVSGVIMLACIGARDAVHSGTIRRFALTASVILSIIAWLAAVPALWDHLMFALWNGIGNPPLNYGAMSDVRVVLERTSIVSYTVSGGIASIGLLGLMGVRGWALWFRRIAAIAGGSLVLAIAYGVAADAWAEWLDRTKMALTIVCTSSLGILSVLWALKPSLRRSLYEPLKGEATASFSCPACATAQIVVLGRRIECPSCALGITLRLDPPRCACGYDLGGLTTEACPECGAAVETRHSWARAIQG